MTSDDRDHADPYSDRARTARVKESIFFALTFFVGASVYTVAVLQVMGFQLDLYLVVAVFLACSLPFEFWLWYKARSVWRRPSKRRIAAIGVAMVTIPCLIVTIVTFGVGLIFVVVFLPLAIPVGILAVWGFLRARDCALAHQPTLPR